MGTLWVVSDLMFLQEEKKTNQTVWMCRLRTLDKSELQKNNFFIFQPDHIMYVVGTQKNRLNETVLLSTQNIC